METGSLILAAFVGGLFATFFTSWDIRRRYWLLPKDRMRYDR